ncbi:hypothetical protein Tco_0766719 [Tanacetum coccineum]
MRMVHLGHLFLLSDFATIDCLCGSGGLWVLERIVMKRVVWEDIEGIPLMFCLENRLPRIGIKCGRGFGLISGEDTLAPLLS